MEDEKVFEEKKKQFEKKTSTPHWRKSKTVCEEESESDESETEDFIAWCEGEVIHKTRT